MNDFAYNKIKQVLVSKRKTSKDLAKHLKVYEPTVSNWCTNQSQPSIKTLYKVAKYLEVEATDLLIPMDELKKIQIRRK